ncbi:ubiquinone/menaquinone biosynthesis C-methylase UbiE [Catenuloplanes nepalensis]|uniref:Ubiquinone/menaquinone biosynthesis C-methylase UbiE n=1 Tax=Catenuloplanes nepalensis TaxID=587533 RepID=A0ABT9MPA2_9ACTN|nr:methyltransferase domain-containing protein [Catenuloplanes nepalensis]MDP9793254.1 ubiquinone/menaquinone biosynthesis C-methylase UbiE [Catenuloplanes nepalensis]
MDTISDFSGTTQTALLRDYLSLAAGSSAIQRVRAAGLAMWEVDGGRLLDVGSGNGEVARELSALLPEAEVTAVDHSADAVATASGLHDGSRVSYEVGDAYALPYPDGHFDGVRSERVLQHLAEPDRAVAEMARVLRPGGRLLLIDTEWQSFRVDGSPENFNEECLALLMEWQARARSVDSPPSGRTLRRRLVTAGLTDVRTEPVTLVFTDLAEAAPIMPIGAEMFAYVGMEDRAAGWLADLERAVADGTFLVTLTIWVAAGTR